MRLLTNVVWPMLCPGIGRVLAAPLECSSENTQHNWSNLQLLLPLFAFSDYYSSKLFWYTVIPQVLPLHPSSPVLASLKMSVELWAWLWAGHWVVETVLISSLSTLPPMLPRPHMGDFWTSPLPVSHNMNWLVSWQAMSTTSQYVVSTVVIKRGGRVSPWQLLLKVNSNSYILCGDWRFMVHFHLPYATVPYTCLALHDHITSCIWMVWQKCLWKLQERLCTFCMQKHVLLEED